MNKFRNSMGSRYLRGLFFETTMADKSSVVYTLKDEDHLGYPSLYRLYMAADDPTEYSFATTYLDGWSHWETLMACSWFKPYIDRWRRELEIRTRAAALLQVKQIAGSNGKEAFQANKFLLSGHWKPAGESRGKGRPSKAEIGKAADELAKAQQNLSDDLLRITSPHEVN